MGPLERLFARLWELNEAGRIQDGHTPEAVEAVPGVGGGPETAVAFGEGRPA